MALYRRIGSTSFQYRSPRAADGKQREQEAVLRSIAEAGTMAIDILLFQEEYGFTESDIDSVPERSRFAPAPLPLPPLPEHREAFLECAIGLQDQYIQRVREAARRAGVNVALPVLERDGPRVFNSLVPVTSRGDLLRPYRKMFPVPTGEISMGISPGTCNDAQEIAGVPVSFAICFDVHFDEVFTSARRSGARLLLWASMWMGGAWLRAHALRNGLYIVSSTPDGCSFIDIDGGVLSESPAAWPQTAGHNNLVFEDLNFDREIYHCYAGGALEDIRRKYGRRVHMRNRPQDSIVIIESVDPDLPLGTIEGEFGLRPWFSYIDEARDSRTGALRQDG